ncbi:unnamed protein product, partial [marine sediment metagenome]
MTIPVQHKDTKTRRMPRVVSGANGGSAEEHALVVATRPLKEFLSQEKFFFNPNEGVDMNVNGAFSGTPLEIHNGTD